MKILRLNPLGVLISLESNRVDWLERVREREFAPDWPILDNEGACDFRFQLLEDRGTITLTVNGRPEDCPRDPEDALRELGNRIHLAIAEFADPQVLVHAGAVIVDGRAIVLPGRSWAGKSTLTMALVERGAQLLSDDFAVFDPDGRVSAYPIPVSQRRPERTLRRPAAELGWVSGTPPAPVAIVLMATYFEPLQKLDWQKLEAGKAVLEMLQHTVAARRAPARCMSTLIKVASQARCWRGLRNEAGPVADWLLEEIGRG